MREDPWGKSPWNRFSRFIAPGADRFAVLCSLLDELRIGFSLASVSGRRHFFISPDRFRFQSSPAGTAPGQREIPAAVLVSHYDRAAGSPGANDNSAAVFILIETALRLGKTPPWLIILTDKEELSRGEGIRDQGSYTLAKALRTAGLEKSRVFIFDACGTGDTLIISTTADYLMKDREGPGVTKTRRMVQELRNQALEAARDLHLERALLLPTPFSDDAGFLRAGFAAQTITALPAREAGPFASLLRNKPDFARALVSREARETWNKRLIPETWRCLNGPADSPLRLTPRYYKQLVRFAAALCGG
ncbi:MAG: Zn-dependent exopeptidase M28 [Spirochaetaceae bacterium]|jgi:hypothetical protein|nr:Zn-dependent exopeptidase M28 [Spirochaetaceae bacterium]